jgi:ferredoxin
VTINRRQFIKGSAAGAAALGLSCSSPEESPRVTKPHRHIDQDACIGCGSCVPLCPMGAISLADTSSIDPHECAECGVCLRSGVCPADAIVPGDLVWPRTLRETFSNPLAKHEDTGVGGRGTEGIKTNDSSNRYRRGQIGIIVELGRPVLGTRFRDVERVVKGFQSRGYDVVEDNPVAGLIADPVTGALRPEILDEKAISVLVEFVMPAAEVETLLAIVKQLDREVETVFNLSVALRADAQGRTDLASLFGTELFSLPNGKVNLGVAEGIQG